MHADHLSKEIPGVRDVNEPVDGMVEAQSEATLRRRVNAGFALAILLTCLISFLSWRMAKQATDDAAWVARTHEVGTTLEATLRHLVDAEAGAQGFARTGGEQFLDPYEAGKYAVGQDLQRLHHLIVDTTQQRRLQTLEIQARNRLGSLADAVTARQEIGESLSEAELERGEELTEAARTTVSDMEEAQYRLLADRTERARTAQHFNRYFIVLGAVAGMVFLILAGAMVSREVGTSARARTQVLALNADLERRVEQRAQALEAEIATRLQSDAKLRVQREHLAAVVGSSDDAIITKDLEGTITAWNRGAEKIFGYAAEEIIGKPVRMLFPPDRLQEDDEILAHMVRGESVGHFETVRLRKDGVRIDVSVTISPVRDGNGVVVGAAKIARDITERKQFQEKLIRSQQALEAEQRMLQSVLDSMVEGLVAADEQGRFILWNPAAAKILGHGGAPIAPETWSKHYGFYQPDMMTLVPADQIPLLRAIRGEVCSAEMFVCNPERTEGVWIEAYAAPLKDKNGVARGGVVAFRDITQKKAADLEIRKLNESLEERIGQRTAELEAANHELEAFTYSVSHDLRAPLRHIMGFAAAFMEEFGAAVDHQAVHYVERMRDGARRMSVLTDELLNLAKTGQKPLRLERTPLNPVVEQIIALLRGETEGREVQWRIGELPVVECDPVLVRQIFQNLLSNAIKYSRPRQHAVIEVGQMRMKDVSAIYVRDNGVGFEMQYANKLFGVFQRLHRDEDFEGTGVGLANVHRIVKKHGGQIWAEAEVDRGATFYFTLAGGESVPLSTEAVPTPVGS